MSHYRICSPTGSLVKKKCTQETNTECLCRSGFVRYDDSSCKCNKGFGLKREECSECEEGFFSSSIDSQCQKWKECKSGVKFAGKKNSDVICNVDTTPTTSNERVSLLTRLTSHHSHGGDKAQNPATNIKTTISSISTTAAPGHTRDKGPQFHPFAGAGMVLIIIGIIGLLVLTAVTCKLRFDPKPAVTKYAEKCQNTTNANCSCHNGFLCSNNVCSECQENKCVKGEKPKKTEIALDAKMIHYTYQCELLKEERPNLISEPSPERRRDGVDYVPVILGIGFVLVSLTLLVFLSYACVKNLKKYRAHNYPKEVLEVSINTSDSRLSKEESGSVLIMQDKSKNNSIGPLCLEEVGGAVGRERQTLPWGSVDTDLKMLALVNRLLDWFKTLFWKEEMELTLVGLQYSGKTTFVNVIASGHFSEDMIPTVGFNMRKVTKGNVTIKIWDIGGQPRFRSMWERYCRGVNSIVYMVDAADQEKVEASRNELHNLLDKPQLQGIPVLVLGNKRDLPNALDEKQLIEKMNLAAIQDREICCYSPFPAKRKTTLT
ncbi:hypothetical protein KUCAC02_030168 [Chaenocephalus aceratus]|uniref:Uncharacterized protein n=1 Tax=Chaenocephalus aceratus TaxID=36190 RepID=A0ACB9XHY9_CHAAC|nr:hypothetical protein KUCAC02_030168 [Chaenocephalus aceratus]